MVGGSLTYIVPIENPLSGLKADTWYKWLGAVAAAAFIAAIAAGNKAAQILALGAALVGLGEWINHPTRSIITPPNAYVPAGILRIKSRSPSLLGWALDLAGLALFGVGLYLLLAA